MQTPVLRRATLNDCEKVYQWRNAPEVRANSINSQPIAYTEHQEWFHQVLKNDEKILLLAEFLSGEPMGVLRFDLSSETADVSIYLAPHYIGQGFGCELLRQGETWLTQHAPQVRRLQAKILNDNAQSQKTFSKAGYQPYLNIFSKEIGNA